MERNSTHSAYTIRCLEQKDWKIWKNIRLEAVKLHPESFGAAFEEEVQLTDQDFQQRLSKCDIFGAFVNGSLVGVAGFFVLNGMKVKHRGTLFSMYLKSEYRTMGIADQLLKALIEHARAIVAQLHCTVVTSNIAAIKLYQKFGFIIYGTEPRSLKVEDQFFDEHLMVLKFN